MITMVELMSNYAVNYPVYAANDKTAYSKNRPSTVRGLQEFSLISTSNIVATICMKAFEGA